MSYILEAIQQIRFPVVEGPHGFVQLIVNRPGTADLDIPATDTLYIAATADPTDPLKSAPFFQSDFPLSKKFTTTKGRRALDDVTLVMRDTQGYSGVVNDLPVGEEFTSTYQTFFDVWFNDHSGQYKAFLKWTHKVTTESPLPYDEVCFVGFIEARYKPSNDADILNPGTMQQVWIGSRTIKIIAGGNAIKKTWQDVLSLIGETDCQSGTPYLGFMYAPPNCQQRSNTGNEAFKTSGGGWYQAVPHLHLHDGSANPVLVRIQDTLWPTAPWVGGGLGFGAYDVAVGGLGYSPGDTGIINGGTTPATYTVRKTVIGTGAVPVYGDSFQHGCLTLTFRGSGYTAGTTYTTTATTGGGSGLQIQCVNQSSKGVWGPSGLVFISVGTLFAKIAAALEFDTFTPSSDLASALDWFTQRAGINKDFPVDSTPIALDNLWVSLNLLAKSHPADGSYWDNPVGFSPDTPISDVINGICNVLLCDFNFINAPTGQTSLALQAMGANAALLPDWPVIGSPTQEEPSTGPRSVQIHNKADDLKIQAPFGVSGDSSAVEVLLRIHRIARTSSETGGKNWDKDAVTFDGKLEYDAQAQKCFELAWVDDFGAYVTNPDCWKSLCYLFWFNATDTNEVYPSTWGAFPNNDGSAGDWSNSFYVVNAIYKSGNTPPTDLQAEFHGDDFFNTRCYHAVAFAELTLALPIVQHFEYSGVSDATGSAQNIDAGIQGQWLHAGNPQYWRGIEVSQLLVEGKTAVKYQAQDDPGEFPELTAVAYGPVNASGGTSTSVGGSTLGGGISQTGTSHFQFETTIALTGVTPTITVKDSLYTCSDPATVGVHAPTTLEKGTVFGLKNNTANDWTSSGGGDFYVPSGAFWLLIYHGATGHTDATLPEGWSAIRDQ